MDSPGPALPDVAFSIALHHPPGRSAAVRHVVLGRNGSDQHRPRLAFHLPARNGRQGSGHSHRHQHRHRRLHGHRLSAAAGQGCAPDQIENEPQEYAPEYAQHRLSVQDRLPSPAR